VDLVTQVLVTWKETLKLASWLLLPVLAGFPIIATKAGEKVTK